MPPRPGTPTRYRVASLALITAAALTTAIYLASGIWYVNRSAPSLSLGIGAGALLIGTYPGPHADAPATWTFDRHPGGLREWRYSRTTLAGSSRLALPLWPAALLLSAAAVWSLWRSLHPPARLLPGHCRACGYNLAGLSQCPECGRTPP